MALKKDLSYGFGTINTALGKAVETKVNDHKDMKAATAGKDTSAGGETNIYGSSSRTNSEPTDKRLATTPEPAALSEKETEILTNIEPLATASASPIAKENKKASTSIASTLINKTSRSVRAKKKVTKKANTTTTEEPLLESEIDATTGQVVGELEVPKKRPRTKHPNVEEAPEPAPTATTKKAIGVRQSKRIMKA
ncbi:hypothetical protein COLO4_27429 [Corchorus olitorius]|uniref:Uncharacterized protein n=1 Tax=Corchorus olitorius TaxID=93759 RepID=A0A1R3HR26_9ROSI|nr:hypothetical protein COLO4_27429 [Corchorus olitorius]